MAKQHIVMFPFMAQGHLIPFLALAKLISKVHPTCTITFVSTPLNIQNLQPLIPPNSNIHLQSLPFRSSDHGLPPESENCDSLTTSQRLKLFISSESLQPEFTQLISDLTRQHDDQVPFLIIADVFFGWTTEIARDRNIFHATFSTCGAYGTAAYFSLWLHLPHIHTDSQEFNIPGFPKTYKLHRNQLSSYMSVADGSDGWSQFFQGQISRSLRSNVMLCNTVDGVENGGLRLLEGVSGLSVWGVGPLLPLDSSSSRGRTGRRAGMEAEEVIKWLDWYRPGEVIYISFGSQNTISASQMMGLASGLETSRVPFIWVVRPPVGFDPSSDFRPEWLPDGFQRRMAESKQGLLVRSWAPQLEILSHRSVGAFLSHCGWNSILESLSRGVAIIGWPLASEQFYNSKMLEEELGVGVELARGLVSEVTSEEVERVVRSVMQEEKGKEMKEKATRLKQMIRDAMREENGSSIRKINELVRSAISFRSSIVL